ncbi:MAG: hypothetical protein ABIM49_04780 [candidate division WOR-3 bacterium]
MKRFLILFLIISGFAQEEKKEYEIKEVYKGIIEERKRVWALFYNPLDAAYEPLLKKGYIFDERFGKGIIKPPLPSLASEELRKAWLQSIVRDEVGFFNPFFEREVKEWELKIVDSNNKVFRTYIGEGKPPKIIKWDGKNEKGEVLDVSLDYFYIFTVKDAIGNEVKTTPKKIKLSGILYEDGPRWIVSVDGNEIFEKNKDKIKSFTLLEEAKSIIKEKARAKVKVVVYGKNPELTKKRYERVMEWIKNNLILPKGKVLYLEGFFKETGFETSRIDFEIL